MLIVLSRGAREKFLELIRLIGRQTIGSKDKDEALLKRKLSALAVSSNPVQIVKKPVGEM